MLGQCILFAESLCRFYFVPKCALRRSSLLPSLKAVICSSNTIRKSFEIAAEIKFSPSVLVGYPHFPCWQTDKGDCPPTLFTVLALAVAKICPNAVGRPHARSCLAPLQSTTEFTPSLASPNIFQTIHPCFSPIVKHKQQQ